MRNLQNRLQRIQDKLAPEERLIVFNVRHGHEKEDFGKQYQRHIANGGSPNDLFISAIDYSAGGAANEP